MKLDEMKRHCLVRISVQRDLVNKATTEMLAKMEATTLWTMANLYYDLELIPKAVRDNAMADADKVLLPHREVTE